VPLPRREHWTRQGCSTKSLTLGPELENQDPKETLAADHKLQRNNLWRDCPQPELAFATTHGAALA